MQKLGLVVITAVVMGLVFAPALSVFAEQNTSIIKPRPSNEEIKHKLKVKKLAADQKRRADLESYKQNRDHADFVRKYAKETSLTDKIMMQYKMFDEAKTQKEVLIKIRSEIAKRDLAEKKHIENLVKSGKTKMNSPEKTTIEYGKTLEDLKNPNISKTKK